MLIEPVDRLEIQILVDNVTDSLSAVPSFVETEMAYHWRHGMKALAGSCLCCGAHGLACLVTACRGDEQRTVLSGANEGIIPETVEALQQFEIATIAAGHCTGWRAVTALANTFGSGVVAPPAVGKRFSFGTSLNGEAN